METSAHILPDGISLRIHMHTPMHTYACVCTFAGYSWSFIGVHLDNNYSELEREGCMQFVQIIGIDTANVNYCIRI